MGLFRTVSEIICDSSRQSQIFSHPLCILRPAEGALLGIGYGHSDSKKTRIMALPGPERSSMIYSAVWMQYINVTESWTDGHLAIANTALMHSVAR